MQNLGKCMHAAQNTHEGRELKILDLDIKQAQYVNESHLFISAS
jgi:hypothetical protein